MGGRIMTEDFEKRFGMTAKKKGFVTEEQLVEALELQVKEILENKKHRFFGRILVDLGYLSQSQLKEVLEIMGSY